MPLAYCSHKGTMPIECSTEVGFREKIRRLFPAGFTKSNAIAPQTLDRQGSVPTCYIGSGQVQRMAICPDNGQRLPDPKRLADGLN
ncbi:hypothetical protein M0L20_19395 [Spirosoma sp. RP8]|uniref:Uncharacterized protein n=1 Tax=Spirosoma liriopis TaxID=2937440 RepID=A0ABT0HPD1_9BACT|nr:hypothetical protein [Spirosoma liriopis]MCK8494040.1 hypothetical protein [Spirosoma liriopis]